MTVPAGGLRDAVRDVMDDHWRPGGYTVPHGATYPFRWLWDSCFHAVVWLELGEPDRAVTELRTVLRSQHDSGFVPHVDYTADPSVHAAFWGRAGVSTLTQPPMLGHAVAELHRRTGVAPDDLVAGAAAHLRFVLGRRHASGLVAACHPWETGCDDSARFDAWGAADRRRWYEAKGQLVASLRLDADGAAVANPAFDCAPAGLAALAAWNASELAPLVDDDGLAERAAEVAEAVRSRWDPELRTYADAGAAAATSGRIRTVDGLMGLLVEDRAEVRAAVLGELDDRAAYRAAFGPRGVHAGEVAYEPRRYWRGGVWPPLAYLLARAGASCVAAPTVTGARRSGLAEWWDPETGDGLGARPQSWSGLALLLDPAG